MRWNEEKTEGTDLAAARGILLSMTETVAPTPKNAEQLLGQCAGHYRHKRWIMHLAAELELDLSNELYNNALQIYFDIKHAGLDWGYISRGWDEPGFRIGQLIEIPAQHEMDFRRKSNTIVRNVATRGIALSIDPDVNRQTIALHLTINIFDEGFNPPVLRESLKNLAEATQQIRGVLPCN